MPETRLDQYLSYSRRTDGRAKITVCTKEAGNPVPERLFGLFTEHLGRNVYGGAWAQLFQNGGFEIFHEEHEPMAKHQIPPLLNVTRARLKEQSKLFAMSELPNFEQSGVAPYWAIAPESKGQFEVKKRDNGGYYQAIAVEGEGEVSIETPLHLPLHRIASYVFSCSIQIAGGPRPDFIKIEIVTKNNNVIGCAKIPLGPQFVQGAWNTVRAVINVNSVGIKLGAELKFRIGFKEEGHIYLDDATLFPTDHIYGWDPEVVQLLKDAKISVLRFPGGNFASGYRWTDGIGPWQLRPEKPNPAWPEWEPNHVGTDEWLTLCELIGAEPLICVNAGSGSATEAANWVRYCNDPSNTKWGKLRAAHGRPDPYNVRLWEVGNELWGDFQINWATPEEYGERFCQFAQAMKEADPTIKLIAIGGSNPSYVALPEHGFFEGLLGANYAKNAIEDSKDFIWAIAEHAVMGGALHDLKPEEIYEELLSHTHHVGKMLRDNVVKLEELGAGEILIAHTEQMMAVAGEDNPSDESLAAAIVWSGFMNWFLRSDGLVPIFTRSAMINHGDFLNKIREVVYPLPGYWGQYLYANQPGRLPLPVKCETPTFTVGGRKFQIAEDIPCLDVVALASPCGEQVSAIIVNRHPEQSITAEIKLKDFKAQERAKVEVLAGPHFSAQNKWFDRERIKPYKRELFATEARIQLPAHSINVLTFKKEKK